MRQKWIPGLIGAVTGLLALLSGGVHAEQRVLAYLVLSFAAYLALRGRTETADLGFREPFIRWLWLVPLGATLTALWSVNRWLSYDAAVLWAAFAATGWLAYLAGREQRESLLHWLMLALFLPVIVTLVRIPLNTPDLAILTYDYKNGAGITMATLLLLSCSLQISQWQSGRSPRSPRGWWPTLLGVVAAVFFWYSGSRASLYVLIAGLPLLALLVPRRRRWQAAALGAVLIILGNLITLGVHDLQVRYAAANDNGAPAGPIASIESTATWLRPAAHPAAEPSVKGRIYLWEAAWRAFLARPWGWGPGTFAEVNLAYAPPQSTIYSNSAHSVLWGSLSDAGPFLLIPLIGLGVAWLRVIVRKWRHLTDMDKATPAGAVAGMAILIAHGVVDLTWDIPAILLTAASLGGYVMGRLTGPTGVPLPASGMSAPRRSDPLLLAWGAVALLVIMRPYYARTLVQEGRDLLQNHQNPQAVATLRRATLVDPLDPEAFSWLAQAYFEHAQANHSNADFALAEQSVQGALKRAERHPALYLQAAEFRLAVADSAGARSLLERGLKYTPHDPSLHIRLAQLDLRDGHAAIARERLQRLLDDNALLDHLYTQDYLRQWRPQLYLTLVQAYIAQGDLDPARILLDRLAKQFPDFAKALPVIAPAPGY